MKLQNCMNKQSRNSNYYNTVVREFFDEKYLEAENHDCFCNHCGSDMDKKSREAAIELAEEKFRVFKKDFEENLPKHTTTTIINNEA